MTDTEGTTPEIRPGLSTEDCESFVRPGESDSGLDLPDEIRILCVDDDEQLLEMTATYLERETDAFTTATASSPTEGREILAETDVDCIVSDYQMPGENGIVFLRSVRDEYPALPFILFTGKGSEEVASDAFEAGSTDYFQKETGPDQYTVLANRVEEAVLSYRAREAVQERERRFRKLIEGSTDVILILADDGTIEYLSPSARQIFGYDLDELLGTTAFDLIHPDDRQAVMEEYGTALENPTYTPEAEYRYRHADGTWHWARAHGRNYLDDPDVSGFVVNIHDVTERKQIEQRYQTLFEESPASTAVLDEDGTILWISQSIEKLFGVGPAEMEGKTAIEFVHPDDRDGVLQKFSETLAADGDSEVEYQYRIERDDGAVRWIETRTRNLLKDPVIEGIVVNTTDITERKEREQQYRQELVFVETILDTFQDIVYVFDMNAEAIRWNDRAKEVLGYTDEELEGMHALEFVAPDEHEAMVPSITEVMAEGSAEIDTTLVTKTGERLPYELRGARLETPEGDVRGFCGIARDVRERNEREQALERQNERLEDFRDLIAYDLRNPLGVARGFLEQARETGDEAHLDRVDESLDRIQALSEELLALADTGRGEADPTTIDLASAARTAWRTVPTEDATLEATEGVTIRANRPQFQQLLENLFRNAVEHGSTSPDSQTCRDAVEHGSTSPDSQTRQDAVDHGGSDVTVTVDGIPDGFSVADDGVGFQADDDAPVFEQDYTTADSGSGLGLSIVREIAHAHGWEVAATTGSDGGARFEFTGVDRE